MLQTDTLQWFPMRVTYHQEMKIKSYLDQWGIESFVPMRYDLDSDVGCQKVRLVPAIHNLIFIHSTQEAITHLKMTKKEFAPVRYMVRPSLNGVSEILRIPESQMANFIKVASVKDDSVTYLDCSDYIAKIGKRVRITAGRFKDVEGVIKRIKKNKYVVVQIDGVAAVAITYVPGQFIEEIS